MRHDDIGDGSSGGERGLVVTEEGTQDGQGVVLGVVLALGGRPKWSSRAVGPTYPAPLGEIPQPMRSSGSDQTRSQMGPWGRRGER